MKYVQLSELIPHPQNPRLIPREDVIDQIAAQIGAAGFDEAHALIVREIDGGYQIISGHHRKLAAERAGVDAVPCWVREMDDETAYMELVRANAQSELTALERGMHALHRPGAMSVNAYADAAARPRRSVHNEVQAAEVAGCAHVGTDLSEHFRALTEIHAAPRWLWSALVSKMVADGLTVETTRKLVAGVKDAPKPPEWSDVEAVAKDLVAGLLTKANIGQFASTVEKSFATIERAEINAEAFKEALADKLAAASPSRLSAISEICIAVEGEQAVLVREKQHAALAEAKQNEENAARTARLRRNVSLDEWKALSVGEKSLLLDLEQGGSGSFNKQENAAIEWAQWSWNPVTGCLHECPYCYARDIANSARMASVYPNAFAPTFRPSMLLAPRSMKVPPEAKADTRFRNVFTCSMADLFGRWVPAEWIEAVLREVRSAPQWNFLFLTKFPKRMAEFDIPDNAWMGTTVDLQARIPNAEAAFANVKAGVRWLSIEPMLEPLKFKHLDRFDWVVIGGASRSDATPEWRPPFEWVLDLVDQARDAGVKVYFKTNLLGPRMIELPFDAPAAEAPVLPEAFHYLNKKAVA